MSQTTALYINGLNVRFGGFAAITDLTLEIRYGETRALIGPNGAGKTTLMDVITGKTRPNSGEVFLDRTLDLAVRGEAEIARSAHYADVQTGGSEAIRAGREAAQAQGWERRARRDPGCACGLCPRSPNAPDRNSGDQRPAFDLRPRRARAALG